MGFYKNPIIEEPPRCIMCGNVVRDEGLICSATCNDLWTYRERHVPLSMIEDYPEDEYADR